MDHPGAAEWLKDRRENVVDLLFARIGHPLTYTAQQIDGIPVTGAFSVQKRLTGTIENTGRSSH